MIPPLFIADESSSADLLREMSLACAHDLAFANNGFASRDDFIDFYRTAAARSETRVENRRKSREHG